MKVKKVLSWTPIGMEKLSPYAGIFDGNGFLVKGLYFNDKDYEGVVGLVGELSQEGYIQNVSVTDTYFFCNGFEGGICGYSQGNIINCHNEGIISDACFSGGVCGFSCGTIYRCSNNGIVCGGLATQSLSSHAGILGVNGVKGIVNECYNTGDVTNATNEENINIGGIVGLNIHLIQNCYNASSITGDENDYVGGIAGSVGMWAESYPESINTIVNCYNRGIVAGGKGNICVRGIVGYYETGKIENNYYVEGTRSDSLATVKSARQFANGEVAFLLSQGCTTEVTSSQDSSVSTVTFDGSAWGQNIDNEGERQYYPALNGDTAKGYETSAESDCKGYSNTKDKVREHKFVENCTDEICAYCCLKNIDYLGLSAECSEITYDGKSHTPEITIKAKKADNSDTDSSDVDNASDAGNSGADSSGGSGNSGNSGADNSGDLPEDAGSLTEGTDYEVSVTPQTDVSADGYTATITGKGAYTGTRTVQWNLTPKEITLTVDGEVSKPYDGTTDVFLDDILTNITTSLDGVLEEDKNDVSAKVSYAFADANANDSVVVNVTKAILEGNRSINYTLAEDITNTLTGSITKLASTPALPQQQERKVAYTVDTVDKVTLPVGWEWAEEDKTKTLTVGETVTATAVYAGADKGNYETESVEIAITRQACTHEGTWDDGKVTKQPTEKETGVKTYTCTVCGETRTEEIPVVKPSGDNGTSDNNGTSDGNGT
ncbi:MAG: YDG domain-containing protein, partial [bacterium]|nr:YDG domain-containing protein [bacterium]